MTTPLNLGTHTLVDEIGRKYEYQGQTTIHGTLYTFTGYEVISSTDLGFTLKQTRIDEGAGKLDGIHTHQRLADWAGELNVLSGSNPATDFPEGKMATLSGFTAFLVVDAKVTKNEELTKLSLKLQKVVDSGRAGGEMASA
jgi:hypothetical protein